MERTELERIQWTLQSMLRNEEQPLRRREEIAVENAPDNVDRCQHAAECDMAILRIESNFSRLRAVRLALDRIAEGTYGTCLRCEEEISPKRLQAVPWAAYCIRCQDLADKENLDEATEGADVLMRMRDVA